MYNIYSTRICTRGKINNLPRAHAQGIKQSVLFIVSINIIAISGHLAIYNIYSIRICTRGKINNLPRAHAQGIKQSVLFIVSINIIAISGHLAIYNIYSIRICTRGKINNLPRAHAQGIKLSVLSIVSISIIAISGDLAIWTTLSYPWHQYHRKTDFSVTVLLSTHYVLSAHATTCTCNIYVHVDKSRQQAICMELSDNVIYRTLRLVLSLPPHARTHSQGVKQSVRLSSVSIKNR